MWMCISGVQTQSSTTSVKRARQCEFDKLHSPNITTWFEGRKESLETKIQCV